MLLLSGDIGGTKTRLRLSDYSKKHYHAHQTETFFNKDFPCLEDIIEHFLAQYQIAKKDIQSACFAIAGPIVNDQVQLTNLTWHIDLPSLKRLMGIENIFLINDFEAIGHAIDSLEPDQLSCLQKGQAQKDALIAVTGPGTGLGVCLVDGKSDHSRVFATEGGHVDFSPANQEQFELLRFLNLSYFVFSTAYTAGFQSNACYVVKVLLIFTIFYPNATITLLILKLLQRKLAR